MKIPPMVVVEWEDSSQAAPQWQWHENVEPPGVCHCVSVGFLVRDDKNEKALAISIADGGKQVSGIISIPTRCVTKVRRLR